MANQQSNSDDNKQVIDRLDQVIKLLTPKPAPTAGKGLKNEFLFFLSQYKVLGLAVAFIIGVYLGAVIMNLATGIILPAIGLIFPGLGNLATYSVTVGKQMFTVGAFIASILTFIIVAFVIFIIVKVATRWGLNK